MRSYLPLQAQFRLGGEADRRVRPDPACSLGEAQHVRWVLRQRDASQDQGVAVSPNRVCV